jgi:hypothetical protein
VTAEEFAAGGWHKLPTKQFSAAIGSLWLRGEKGAREVGVFTTPAIANDHMGMVHGWAGSPA